MERRRYDERSFCHHEGDKLERGLKYQNNNQVQPRVGYNQAFAVERGRVDLIMLIPMTRRCMMIVMGVLVAEGVRFLMPCLVRQAVKQRNADREEIRDRREHQKECASATLHA